MAEVPPPKRAKLVEQLVVPANEAITFKLLYGGRGKALLHSSLFCLVWWYQCLRLSLRELLYTAGAADASAAGEFAPEMTHQVFGDDEEIKGHEQPQAIVWISNSTFETAVEFHSSSQQPGATKVCCASRSSAGS